MSDSSPDLPEVEPRDPEPVAVAIETARALFRSGERLDAVRWLRRAAERAEEAGDDVRSVHLARSAADLSTELQSVAPPPSSAPSSRPPTRASVPPPPPPRASVPPPPPPPVPPPALGEVLAVPPTSRRADDATTPPSYDDYSDKTIVDKSPVRSGDSGQHSVQIGGLPESQSAPRSITMPSPSSVLPIVPRPPLAANIVPKPSLRQAQRVAVSPDPKSPGAWLVRPLADTVSAPPGSEECLLVALDPRTALFG